MESIPLDIADFVHSYIKIKFVAQKPQYITWLFRHRITPGFWHRLHLIEYCRDIARPYVSAILSRIHWMLWLEEHIRGLIDGG